MKYSAQLNEIGLAMSKVQGKIKTAKKDCNNPFFRSKYADLTSVSEACREELAEHEIAVVQGNSDDEGKITVVTLLLHSSGQWIESSLSMSMTLSAMPAKIDKYGKTTEAIPARLMNAQEIGSVITYFRRYSLASMVGVCPEDDDANIASNGKNNPPISKDSPEKKVVQTINTEQFNELNKALDAVPAYRATIKSWMTNNNMNDMFDIPISNYEEILRVAKSAAMTQIKDKSA